MEAPSWVLYCESICNTPMTAEDRKVEKGQRERPSFSTFKLGQR